MKLDVNGVTITLTQEQLKQIAEQTETKTSVNSILSALGESDTDVILCRKLESAGIDGLILSTQFLVCLAKYYNKGWEPDFENSNEYKYYPYWNMKTNLFNGYSLYVYVSSYVPAPLLYKRKEDLLEAVELFHNEFKMYFTQKLD